MAQTCNLYDYVSFLNSRCSLLSVFHSNNYIFRVGQCICLNRSTDSRSFESLFLFVEFLETFFILQFRPERKSWKGNCAMKIDKNKFIVDEPGRRWRKWKKISVYVFCQVWKRTGGWWVRTGQKSRRHVVKSVTSAMRTSFQVHCVLGCVAVTLMCRGFHFEQNFFSVRKDPKLVNPDHAC